ncbi:MAG: DUF3006 domain-containing protein [Bacilli bacterium]|nr:DUF3006 domain-containing protein [Bacilli bacterium]
MYTVEKIEDTIVSLENRNNKEIIEIKKDILPNNIKEGDILDYIDNKYIINKVLTNKVKNNIKKRFSNLIE